MNKEKLIKYIETRRSLNKEQMLSCTEATARAQFIGHHRECEILKDFIQSEPEETCYSAHDCEMKEDNKCALFGPCPRQKKENKTSDCMGCHEINEYQDIYNQEAYPNKQYARISIVGMHNGKEKGETTGKKIPLNFCPKCGRKIKAGE